MKKLIFFYILGIALLMLWWQVLGTETIERGLAKLHLPYVYLSTTIIFPVTLLESLRLYLYLKAQHEVRFFDVLRLYLIVSPAGYFLSFYSIPLTALLSWYLFAIPSRYLFAGFFYTQVLNIFFPALFLFFFPFPTSVLPPQLHLPIHWLTLALSAIAFLGSLLFLILSLRPLIQRRPIQSARTLLRFSSLLTIPLRNFFFALLISFSLFLLQAAGLFLGVWYGASVPISFPHTLSINALNALTSFLPNLPADLGLQEIRISLFLYLLSLPKDLLSAAVVLIHSFDSFHLVLIGCLGFLLTPEIKNLAKNISRKPKFWTLFFQKRVE